MTSTHLPAQARAAVCAITLIDLRTGRPHRVNGAALVALSRNPDLATAELLAGRDTRFWTTRIQPVLAPTHS